MAAARFARSLGGMVLDRRFEERSPIPHLPAHHRAKLEGFAVHLPPLSLFSPGNQSPTGLLWLTTLARALDARTVFEIGTYNGLTALTLAMNLQEATIHTLDLPPDARTALAPSPNDRLNLRNTLSRVYEGRPEERQIVQHLDDSALFDYSAYRRAIDLVYIDGAHSYDYVRNDTSAAYEMVSGAGAIVWDDYWRLVPDVPSFLDGLHERELYRLPDSRLVVWLARGDLLTGAATA